MTEPTVQVPVSLIRSLYAEPAISAYHKAVLRALLSQPTPTADMSGLGKTRGKFSEPPRIEDMAPGTTFRLVGGHGMWMRTTDGAVHTSGVSTFGVGIDPSTIRDVTPPKDAA